MLLIETTVLLIAILIAIAWPRGFMRFEKAERAFPNASRLRGLSVLFVGILAIGVRLAVLPILPVPQPGFGDEFCHLLAADTFAHHRITNPPHAMWVHLENLDAIQQPTYASKCPPG